MAFFFQKLSSKRCVCVYIYIGIGILIGEDLRDDLALILQVIYFQA